MNVLKKAFFTPQGFYGVASKSVTGLYTVSAVLFLVGFYLAFFVCPIDATRDTPTAFSLFMWRPRG